MTNSSPSLIEVLAKIAELEKQAAEIKKAGMTDAIAKARAIVDEYDLTVSDVFPVGKTKVASAKDDRKVVAAKFRNPETGATWSGRGLRPKWIGEQDKEVFRIPGQSV